MKRLLTLLLAVLLAVIPVTAPAEASYALEERYLVAAEAMVAGDFAQAAAGFEALLGYSDAAQMGIYCRALAFAQAGDTDTALLGLRSLAGYKDSTQLADYIQAGLLEAEAKKQELKGMNGLQAAAAAKRWRSAAGAYARIPFYRDSLARRQELETMADRLEDFVAEACFNVSGRLYSGTDYEGNVFVVGNQAVRLDGTTVKIGSHDSVTLGFPGNLAQVRDFSYSYSYTSGLVSLQTGEPVGEKIWYNLSPFNDTLIRCEKNGKYGLLNTAGELVVPCEYSEIRAFNGDQIRLRKDDLYGFAAADGTIIADCEWESVSVWDTGLVQVNKNQLTGLIAETGVQVLPAEYSRFVKLDDGLIRMQKGKLYGVVAWDGTPVLPCEYASITVFDEALLKVCKDDLYGLVSRTGAEVLPVSWGDIAATADDGYVAVCNENGWGVVTLGGETVLPCEYQNLTGVLPGIVAVRKNRVYALMNLEGTLLTPYSWERVSAVNDSLIRVRGENGLYGLLKPDGTQAAPCIYESIDGWEGQPVYIASRGGLYGYLDETGAEVIPCTYRETSGFGENGLALVDGGTEERGDWYFIDRTGNRAADGYLEIWGYRLMIGANGLWGMQDETGTWVMPCEYDRISGEGENAMGMVYATVMKDGRMGVYDLTNGRLAVPCNYRSVTVQGLWSTAYEDDGSRTIVLTASGEKLTGDVMTRLGNMIGDRYIWMMKENGEEVTYGLIDGLLGRIITPCQWSNIFWTNENAQVAFVETTNEVGEEISGLIRLEDAAMLHKCQWTDVSFDQDAGVARVSDGNGVGLVDLATGELLLPCEFDNIGYAYDGVMKIEQDDQVGYVRKDGTIIVPCEWEWANNFNRGYGYLTSETEIMLVDDSGAVIGVWPKDDVDAVYFSRNGIALGMNGETTICRTDLVFDPDGTQ